MLHLHLHLRLLQMHLHLHPRELVEQFQYLDPAKLVPYEKLTAETAMYWRVLAQYLRCTPAPVHLPHLRHPYTPINLACPNP